MCVGCGQSTLGEFYRLRDHIWAGANCNATGAELCIGCVDERLGRRLTREDFDNVPANFDRTIPKRQRLLYRLGIQPAFPRIIGA